jgi:hypothetical protein
VSVGSSDVESLRAQARAASISALTALGKQLLVGERAPLAPAKGVEVLEEAALRGDAEAHRQLSVCAAWGVGCPRDFARGLNHLQLAALGGSNLAQRELQLLARVGGTDWAALRRSVDVGALMTPPGGSLRKDRPRIIVVERFMTPAECEWVIARGRSTLHRARVYRSSATPQVAETRTNRETSFTIFQADVALAILRERMSAATRAPPAYFEVTKLLHYEPGQEFALHADFIQPGTPELARELQLRGQRAATLLVYLNEEYEGGETDFPRIAFRFKGRLGDALIFSNIDPAGAPDFDTVHAGLPPTRGEKWLLSQWIRTRPMIA